ncbi:metal transporter Nramp5-like [Durio zibethinus]|uniref:Metal transporter Nramp5-like n=1 Tax=Durio zibethinus TaxID=66656 RepID=A0A6P5ZLN1_DURZI|nr:metal transporter Nramp5-like [Durio zibethinus]
MGSLQQQQGSDITLPQSWDGGSNRIASINVEGTNPQSFSGNNSKRFDHDDPKHDQRPGWRKFLSFVGPGFLVSIAYLDPGNLETDLQAGANHRFELLWVLFIGLVFALVIQVLAANLGVSTGKHLSELCREEYPKVLKYCLWLSAEVAVISADIPEVIGTAFALNILFHIPVWVGVLCTGLSTLLLLGLQRYGARKLEMFIAVMILVMSGCFFGEMGYVKPPASGVIKGIFVPNLAGQQTTGDAIALMGAIVTPHNLFLHSALVLSRKVSNSVKGINAACRYFLIETGLAMLTAFFINLAVVSVSGTVCAADNLSSDNQDRCNNIDLDSASFLLKNVLGKSSSILYGTALLASGQSSTITGTYAGQFIMQGFLNIKMKKWARNLMTRSIAITPSLVVAIISGPQGAGRLIIIASIILSFELPFSLIPLLKFSNSSAKMGPHKNSIFIIVISWILALGVFAINIYFLSTSFVSWLIHSHLSKVGKVFIGIIVFPIMAIYILAIIYLAFRKDTVVTYTVSGNNDPAAQARLENGPGNPDRSFEDDDIPYREDLADIPLPE